MPEKKEKNIWMYTTIILAMLLIGSIYINLSIDNKLSYILNNLNIQDANTGQNSGNKQGNDIESGTGNLVDDDPVKGDVNAPVTIVEFSDFQCPFCGRFHSETLPQIEENYIATGKVKLVYRDFPLTFHQQAQSAAEAAECADEQGKFWEFHDKIFENQDSIGTDSYKQWAAELGLNTQQFNECVDSGKYRSEVQKDFTDGSAAGVSGTPTFFINGKKIMGAQPYSVFEAVIKSALGN